MSISTTGNRESHLGDGVSTNFPFPYPFFANSDIHVFVDGEELTTGFTVSGAGTGTGTVAFMVAPAVGAVIVLVRIPSNLQPTVISENDEFPAKIVEGMSDRLTLQIQRHADLIGRSLTLSDADSSSASLTLPTPTPSAFLGWNSTGDALVNYVGLASVGVTAAMAPVVSATTLALARAAMGITPANIGAVSPGLISGSGLTMNTGRALLRSSAGVGPIEEATAAQMAAFIGGTQQPGEICYFATNTLPTGFLKCNGAAVSRTTYAALFAALVKSSTVTMTISSPGVITWNAHGRSANDPVKFSTTGALPTGLTAGTTYYVVGASITTNTFQVSATAGGAAINTSGTQSGTHTAIHAPFGDGDGSTTFNLPELRGEFLRGWDDGRAIDSNRAFGSSQTDAMQGHFHGGVISAITTTAQFSAGGSQAGQVPANTTGPTSDGTNGTPRTAAETRPRNVALMACIKF